MDCATLSVLPSGALTGACIVKHLREAVKLSCQDLMPYFCVDAELAALETMRDKTRAVKQVMMQELLTGRIRLV